MRPSLLLRSARYRRLDAEPAIRLRTDFFAAASIVTRVLAYGGATRFMLAVSDMLERANVSRARLICPGALYATGSVARNTSDFIRYEQALVQDALDRLRSRDPGGYEEQVRIANSAIALIFRRRGACASGAAAAFVAAVESCLERLGRSIEFSRRSDREALGEEIARSARRRSAAAADPAYPASRSSARMVADHAVVPEKGTIASVQRTSVAPP